MIRRLERKELPRRLRRQSVQCRPPPEQHENEAMTVIQIPHILVVAAIPSVNGRHSLLLLHVLDHAIRRTWTPQCPTRADPHVNSRFHPERSPHCPVVPIEKRITGNKVIPTLLLLRPADFPRPVFE